MASISTSVQEKAASSALTWMPDNSVFPYFTPAPAATSHPEGRKAFSAVHTPWRALRLLLLTTFNLEMELSGTSEVFLSMHPTDTAWSTEYTPSEDGTTRHTVRLILLLLSIIVALAGISGNVVVLWLLGFRMRRNTFSVYILNLAGADCIFLCSNILLFLEYIMQWDLFSSDIHGIVVSVYIFAYIAGLSILSAISTERCLSVLWPIWYRCRRPRHLSAIVCALIWLLSLLLSILEGMYCVSFSWKINYFKCPVFEFIIAGWLILLFMLLSGSSLVLMTRLLCGSQRVPLTRLYVTLMVTVLVFLLCGLPIGIDWFLLSWVGYYFPFPLKLVVIILSCVNSCANPIIYFLVGSFRQRWRKGRQTLRLVLQRALQDTPEVQEHRESLPQGTLEMSGSTLMS
ncbi:mas-related G-protein coupled receptor member X2-like [Molossus nigricans]